VNIIGGIIEEINNSNAKSLSTSVATTSNTSPNYVSDLGKLQFDSNTTRPQVSTALHTRSNRLGANSADKVLNDPVLSIVAKRIHDSVLQGPM
jgi:hypothetical protein